jgi:hypothetical protein
MQSSDSFRDTQIEHCASLAEQTVRDHAPLHIRVTGRIDPQHVRPDLREEPSAYRSGDHPGQVEDPHTGGGQLSFGPSTGCNLTDELMANQRFAGERLSLGMASP